MASKSTRKLPTQPTQAEPGSEEKILVLMGRAARGEQLHHDGDRKAGGARRSDSDHRGERVIARRRERINRVVKARADGQTLQTIAKQEGVSRGQVVRDLDLASQPLNLPEPKGTGLVRVNRRYKTRLWVPRLRRQIDLGYFRSVEEGLAALARARALLGLTEPTAAGQTAVVTNASKRSLTGWGGH